jgi:flagellar biosynthesis/type III secretory pathway chaperone
VDSTACRESLGTLLFQEIASLNELAGQLDREHALLVANDVTALETAMEQRQVTLGRVLRLEDERRALGRAHGPESDAAGLERLMKWCDPKGSLASRWADYAQATTRCRDSNLRNGALVAARMRRVETLLNTLTGQPVEVTQSTYGPKGAAAYNTPRSGRVLTTEA